MIMKIKLHWLMDASYVRWMPVMSDGCQLCLMDASTIILVLHNVYVQLVLYEIKIMNFLKLSML